MLRCLIDCKQTSLRFVNDRVSYIKYLYYIKDTILYFML